jgi:hypothetical protein
MPLRSKPVATGDVVHLYVGVDPGWSGGIAVIDGQGKLLQATPSPDNFQDFYEMVRQIRWLKKFTYTPIKTALEKVHSMPQQGAPSTFKFGQSYGAWQMVLAVMAVEHDDGWSREDVTPQAWQKAIKFPQKKRTPNDRKKDLLEFARNLYPKFDWPTTQKDRFAICDAILIATYLYRKDNGKL